MALHHDTVVQLLLKHRGKLLGAIRAMVFDEHLAEDIFQEVSIVAISKCEQITDAEHFAPWFRSAAKFQSLMALRNRKRLPLALSSEVLEIMESHWQRFDGQIESDLADALRKCLKRLGPYAQKLIEKRYIEGKRGNNLAEVFKRNMNTVYVALTRAHTTLRDCIKQEVLMERNHG
jgi:RNA polymerase sigma-70 factor (ECF subfamily)